MNWDGRERRRAIRVKFPYTIIINTSGGDVVFTYTEDIGANGVKVVIRQRLEVNSPLELKIYIEEEPLLCKGRVAWVRERESRYLEGTVLFDTGIEFSQIGEEERALIKSCTEALAKKNQNTQ